MNKSKQLESIIFESLDDINILLPAKKKIKRDNFRILNNKLFDSLNYIIFLLSLEKKIKIKFKKKIILFDLEKTFKNKKDLTQYLLKKI